MQVINQQLARKQVAKSLVGIWVDKKNEIKASEKFGFHIPFSRSSFFNAACAIRWN